MVNFRGLKVNKKCSLPVTKYGSQGSPGYGGSFKLEPGFPSRDLKGVNPNNEQFAPSDDSPIRTHQKMAGQS